MSASHPIVEHFFILSEDKVLFPVLQTPPILPPLDFKSSRLAAHQSFYDCIARAEQMELRSQHPKKAIALYRSCLEVSTSEDEKALSLSRIARCLQKSKQLEAAQQEYQGLVSRFGDLYDPYLRPYGITGALELVDLSGQTQFQSLLRETYSDLAGGRWELAGDQAGYYAAELRSQLGQIDAAEHKSPFLFHFQLAENLEESFNHQGPMEPSQVYRLSFNWGEQDSQIFYRRLNHSNVQGLALAFSADLDWIKEEVIETVLRESGKENLGSAFRLIETDEGPMDTMVRAPFKNGFPFWELGAESESLKSRTRLELLALSGATIFVMFILGMGIVLLLRDVSREKKINRLRSEFVSNVSHELKTPLTLIRLYGETLLHDRRASPEEQRNYAEIITRESERLTHLIAKVLDFSRIERGQKQYKLEEGDLGESLATTIETYRQYLVRRGFEVDTEISTELPTVAFDRDAVSQAALNLLDNAAKYSGDSRKVSVRVWAEYGKVFLEVEDQGIGIPKENQSRLFQEFYRSAQGQGKGGYGIGLFLVKHIMEAHNGRVEVESEVGTGSKFRLVFPTITTQGKQVTANLDLSDRSVT